MDGTPSHVTFSRCFSALITVSHMTLAQGVLRARHLMYHPHGVVVFVLFDSPLCSLHRFCHLPLHSPDLPLHPHLPCGSVRRGVPCALSRLRSLTLSSTQPPLTGYEPKAFDDYHFSETTEFFIQESSSDSRPSYLHDLEIDDYTIGRALSSPLFTQEREEPAGRRQAYHSPQRKFVVKSVHFCVSCKNGETRV